MTKKLLSLATIATLGIGFSGCSAKMSSVNDGTNGTKGGVVEYNNGDKLFGYIVNKRKQDAIKKMSEYCAPLKYKETKKENKYGFFMQAYYMNITFECVNK